MHSLLPDDSAIAPDWEASAVRLALAIALSLALHVAVIFGLRISSTGKTTPQPFIIQARLETFQSVSSQNHAHPSPIRNKPVTPKPIEPVKPLKREEGGDTLAKPILILNSNQDVETAPPAPLKPEDFVVKQPDKPAQPVHPRLDTNIQAFNLPQTEDETYYTAKEVDVHPTLLTHIHMDYPEKAQENKIEGNVVVVMLIDEKGMIRDISIVKADPPGYFEKTVIDAFKGALFSPAIRHGQAVKSRVRYSVHFGS